MPGALTIRRGEMDDSSLSLFINEDWKHPLLKLSTVRVSTESGTSRVGLDLVLILWVIDSVVALV